jgi:hypothetical protein
MFDGERCIRCNTYYKFEELGVAPGGFSICRPCSEQIDPAKEKKRGCPVDGTEMRKEFVQDLVLIDRCTSCGGVWLDGDELRVIERGARSGGDFWLGFMLGIAVG